MLRSSAAGRAWRRPRSVAPFRRPSRENPGRAPGRRPLPFALDVSFVGRHANRDDAHEDGTDANDGFRRAIQLAKPLARFSGTTPSPAQCKVP
jgi:hypothetical protein